MVEKKDQKYWIKWTDDTIENLVNSLGDFKTKINFRGLDFNGDCLKTRKVTSTMYEKKDIGLFGGVECRAFSQNQKEMESLEEEIKKIKTDIKEHNSIISGGKNNMQENIKETRQFFSKAF